MLIRTHGQVQCTIDHVDAAIDTDQTAIGCGFSDGEAVRLRPADHCLVIGLRRAKLLGVVLDRQIMMIVWAGRIIELLEQLIQSCLVGYRQIERELQMLLVWQQRHARHLAGRHGLRHVLANYRISI